MLLDRSRWAEKKGQRERERYSSIYAINGRRVGGKLRYLTLVGRSRWFVLLKLVQAILVGSASHVDSASVVSTSASVPKIV